MGANKPAVWKAGSKTILGHVNNNNNNNMGTITIEKNIPIPARASARARGATLKGMDVGDSIVVPRAAQGSWRGCARFVKMKVAVRKISDTEVRLWRTA